MMKTISNISAPASIFGFLIIFFSTEGTSSLNIFQWVFLAAFFVFSIAIIIIDRRNSPKTYSGSREINRYMLKWISKIGRVVIFTRDMSWANDRIIVNKLLEKAKNDELIICMPKINELGERLQKGGAKIVEYSNVGYVPQSRFTIVHYERNDAKVAIGKTDNDIHVIEEFKSGQALFHVTQDLVNILIKADEAGRCI